MALSTISGSAKLYCRVKRQTCGNGRAGMWRNAPLQLCVGSGGLQMVCERQLAFFFDSEIHKHLAMHIAVLMEKMESFSNRSSCCHLDFVVPETSSSNSNSFSLERSEVMINW